METQGSVYLNVELKPNYFNEFIVCGIPIPQYVNSTNFVLMFSNAESYTNYMSLLRFILKDLERADPENCKYEIQRSIIFIKNILFIIKNQFSEKVN